MLASVPTLSHWCRIAEPPQPASDLPAQSERKLLKTFSRHRFPRISRLSLPAWLLLIEERPTPSSSICLTGLKAPIGGSQYAGPTTFLTGWLPPLNERPFSLPESILTATLRQSSPTLSSSGVA